MRRLRFHSRTAAVLLAFLSAIGAASAFTPLERRAEHPDGTSLLLKGIDLRPDSIVLSVTIANSGSREIRLNGAQGLTIVDDANGVHYLNPPAGNPALRVSAGTVVSGDLVFVGPLSPAARQLRISSNEGIGTTDNPFDDTPILRTTISAPAGQDVVVQANHPDATALRIISAKAGPASCLISLTATNGNERAVRLNQSHSLLLEDGRGGGVVPLAPPANPDLTVPPASQLKADLVFPCQKLDTSGSLTLTANRGTGGTTDNPYEATPVFTVAFRPIPTGEALLPARSRTSVSVIARSQLAPIGSLAENSPAPTREPAVTGAAPAPPAPPAPAPLPPTPAAASPASPAPAAGTNPGAALGAPDQEAASLPATPASPPEQKQPEREPPRKVPQSVAELKRALQAKTTEHGIRVVLPADMLFDGVSDTLGPQAEPALTQLHDLIAAAHPREVTVAGHSDSIGEDAANQSRSENRAKAVGRWLTEHAGKKPPRFVEQGFGRTRPVAPNHNADGSDNPQGRAKNRRIEITLSRPAKEPKDTKEPKEANEPERKR